MKPIDNKQLNENYPVSLKGGTRVNQLKNPEVSDNYDAQQLAKMPKGQVTPKMPNKQ
jgi:hypothetical protein